MSKPNRKVRKSKSCNNFLLSEQDLLYENTDDTVPFAFRLVPTFPTCCVITE